jgi:hypothetical protein
MPYPFKVIAFFIGLEAMWSRRASWLSEPGLPESWGEGVFTKSNVSIRFFIPSYYARL